MDTRPDPAPTGQESAAAAALDRLCEPYGATSRLAKLLGSSYRLVYRWRKRECRPNAFDRVALDLATGGAVPANGWFTEAERALLQELKRRGQVERAANEAAEAIRDAELGLEGEVATC